MNIVLLSHSRLYRDPRILRQISWTTSISSSAQITTIGCGPKPEGAHHHHEIPVTKLMGRLFAYSVLRRKRRFDFLYGKHLDQVLPNVFQNADLIIINEVEYLPHSSFLDSEVRVTPTYLDLHEDHTGPFDRGFLERLAFRKYGAWQFAEALKFVRTRIGTAAVTSVEESIAKSYSNLMSRDVDVIQNAPNNNNLTPTHVEPDRVRLVHHGMGTSGKGIETSIRALKRLDARYTLDLILFSTKWFDFKIRALSLMSGVSQRVRILPGVPLDQLPKTLNDYDVALVIMSGTTQGLWKALPNKLFESIHAKLAIVCGPNPSIRKVVVEHSLGISLSHTSAQTIAEALNNTSTQEWIRFKSAASVAAPSLSASQGRDTFGRILDGLLS